MGDGVDDFIKMIAVKHGIAVGRDDPILILQTINAKLLEDGVNAQRAQLQQHQEELEAIAQRWGHDAKDKAERILTAGLSATKEAMARLMQEGAAGAATNIRGEISDAVDEMRKAVQEARDLGRLNLISAAITLIAAAVALFATLR